MTDLNERALKLADQSIAAYPNSPMANAIYSLMKENRNLQAQLIERDGELEAARAEVERLSRGVQTVTSARIAWAAADQHKRLAETAKQQRDAALAQVGRLREAFEEIEGYFDQRADAEYQPGQAAPVGNEEMEFLTLIRQALAIHVKGVGG